MIYIFTALYCEAQIFIRQFNLTKNHENTWLQEFYSETSGIRLTITGVGEIAAAAAVSSICSVYRPTQDDLLLNVGICAHSLKNNGIFLCNKIIESETEKTFYPDMLYRHNFCEGIVVTSMLPWNGKHANTEISSANLTENLYDMEAAAVYQTGIHFFGPHQMSFLKIVSDRGISEKITPERTVQLMEKYQDCIFDYIEQLSAITQDCHKNCTHQQEESLIETFCSDLHCSKTMRVSVKQYIHYLALTGIDYVSMIQDMYEIKLLPCKDKREGKVRFEEFKGRIF